jgi:hypothetical protein
MLRLIASGSTAPRGFGQGSFFARPLRAADVPDYIAARAATLSAPEPSSQPVCTG